ncbi:MAG: EAL domain-containing protein [Lachnospiraceae bacterium]|nr:EAL domain-containing protein [Lachnospiraceae bacterium]
MNVATQICGLLIISSVLIFNMIRKKIRLKSSDNFIQLVVSSLVPILLDMLSCMMLFRPDVVSNNAITVVYKLRLVSIVLGTIFGVRYLCSDVYKQDERYRNVIFKVWALALVQTVLVASLPVSFELSESGDRLVPYGTALYLCYAFSAVDIGLILIILLRNKNEVNSQRRKAIVMWALTWWASGIVQLMYSDAHAVSFGSALGIMLIYFSLENPEANMDRASGFFNESALSMYGARNYNRNISFSMVFISFASKGISTRVMLDRTILKEIVAYFNSLGRGEMFRTGDMEGVIAFESKEECLDAFKLIHERFSYGWGEHKNVYAFMHYVLVPDTLVCNNWETLVRAVKYAESEMTAGEDTIKVTKELVDRMMHENDIEEIIRDAIDCNRVEVFYQPVFSTAEKKFVAAEALARIRKRDGTLLVPAEFIDVAEKSGMVIRLGEIVFEKVCQFMSREALHERYDISHIGINLSAAQCAYDNLADSFISVINVNHVEPSRIELEITESGSLSARETLKKNMSELMLYGVGFSLDGFGTGRSDFNNIFEMPVNKVTVARELVRAYFVEDNARHILSNSIQMLRDLGMKIVLEGVETAEELEALKKFDAEYIQGYIYSKPLSGGDYLTFLENNQGKA